MAAGISEIRDEVARLVVASTADVEPGIAFRELPYQSAIQDLEVAARPSETIRGFHVLPRLHAGVGSWSPYPELLGVIDVEVRYQVDRTTSALRRLWTLASADAARLHREICEPTTGAWGSDDLAHAIGIELESTTLDPAPDREGIWIMTLRLVVRYILGD